MLIPTHLFAIHLFCLFFLLIITRPVCCIIKRSCWKRNTTVAFLASWETAEHGGTFPGMTGKTERQIKTTEKKEEVIWKGRLTGSHRVTKTRSRWEALQKTKTDRNNQRCNDSITEKMRRWVEERRKQGDREKGEFREAMRSGSGGFLYTCGGD